MPSIELTKCDLHYHATPLFSGLNLSIPLQCWTAILGPSGIGKSTLLSVFSGLLKPFTFTEEMRLEATLTHPWGTQDLTQMAALMTQQNSLFSWLSALSNVWIGARFRGQNRREAKGRAHKLLVKMGLEGHVHKRPSALSGGMQQRVALARTLFEDRALVCLDEPFSALDTVTKFKLYQLVKTQLEARTVIHVTHDPREAIALADRLVVLAGQPGQVVLEQNELRSIRNCPQKTESLCQQILELMANA